MEVLNSVPTVTPAKPKRKLSARKLLKIKRNKIQGRINKLRSDLADLEPVLAKLNARLDAMNPELHNGECS
jgi:hypothetical protein